MEMPRVRSPVMKQIGMVSIIAELTVFEIARILARQPRTPSQLSLYTQFNGRSLQEAGGVVAILEWKLPKI